MRSVLTAFAAIFLGLSAGNSASATPITLSPSTTGAGSFDFDASTAPPGSLIMSTLNATVGDAASFNGDTGTYTFSVLLFFPGVVAGPESGGKFPLAANTQHVTITLSGGDTATFAVSWATVAGGSLTPSLDGTYDVTSAIGDPTWRANFAAGDTGSIDLVLDLQGGLTLAQLVTQGTSSEFAPINSGTIGMVPAPLIGHGFPVVLAVGGLLFGAKLLERSKNGRSLGTAIPHAAGRT
jgi:hypothetical protein